MSDAPGRLAGKTVVLTRAESQNAALAGRLEALGAFVVAVPTLRFSAVEPEENRAWLEALEERRSFTHIVFTSQVAVRFFAELSGRAGVPPEGWDHCRTAVVGGATAEALRKTGREPDLVATRSRGADLAAELIEREGLGPGARVLLPQSEVARPEAGELLRAAGVAVEEVPIYRTLTEEPSKAETFLQATEAGRRVDAIVFASPSALHAFLDLTGETGHRVLARAGARIVTIGPTTSAAVREAGFAVGAEASSPDTDGIVEAVVEALAPGPA